MQIDGKISIVIGGASDFGEGPARMLTANGGKVVINEMQTDKGEAVACGERCNSAGDSTR